MPRTAKRVYFARALCMYGHPKEVEELRFLRASFPGHRIVNPADYDERDMAFYRTLVSEADGVVFKRLFGKITSGVGDEVNHALSLGKEVFELKAWEPAFPDWALVKVERPVRFVGREASIALYRRFEGKHPVRARKA